MDMGDGEEFVLRPMNCPHHQVFKHACSLLPWCQSMSAEIGMMHRYEIWSPSRSSTCAWNVTQCDGHLFVLQNKSKKNSNVPSVDYRCFMKTSTWLNTAPSLFVTLKMLHKYFDNDEMWNAQTMLRAALDEMGVDYWSWRWGLLRTKIGYQRLGQLSEKKPFLLSSLTSCCPFDLKYIGLMWRTPSSYMIHRGVISTMEPSQLSWLRTKVSSQHGLHHTK